jgi:hypothetical protein
MLAPTLHARNPGINQPGAVGKKRPTHRAAVCK